MKKYLKSHFILIATIAAITTLPLHAYAKKIVIHAKNCVPADITYPPPVLWAKLVKTSEICPSNIITSYQSIQSLKTGTLIKKSVPAKTNYKLCLSYMIGIQTSIPQKFSTSNKLISLDCTIENNKPVFQYHEGNCNGTCKLPN